MQQLFKICNKGLVCSFVQGFCTPVQLTIMLMFRCQVGRKFAEQRRTIGSQLHRSLGDSLRWFIWLPWCYRCLQ